MESALTFPTRPQVSTKFQKKTIPLVSNHFSISLSTKQPSIYLYDIKILDIEKDELVEADARIKRSNIIKAALPTIKELFGNNFWYSGQMLWSIKAYAEAKNVASTSANKNYTVSFNKVKEINLRPETFQDNTTAAPARHYINVLIKRYFKEKSFVEWGMNSKFYNPDPIEIPDFYLQIYTGFKTSCEVYQNFTPKILVDFSSRILRSDSALYYINQTKSSQDAREMLQGRSVVASYGNYRMWRVDDIDFQKSPKTYTFESNGKKMTLCQYYKDKYDIKIQKEDQPLLISFDRRLQKEFVLIPELVQMTGLDDEMRANFKLMNEVAKFTRLDPSDRYNRVKDLSAPLADYFSKNYGITMKQESKVEGILLPPPKLQLGKNSFVPDKGNYQLRDPIFKPAVFDKWLFIYSEACKQDATTFVETLKKCSSAYAIKVSNPKMVGVKEKSPEALKKVLRENLKADTQIVVVMFPPIAKKHWYKPLKDVCNKENGVPCQAVVSKSLEKNAMSVCSKILLQMNAKIGMELWITEKPVDLPEKTMIIGADVFHNTKIGQEKKSCIGFCASLDPKFSKFFSKISLQKKTGEEIMKGIGALAKEAVLKYFAFNGKKFFPEYIIFYRDGLAENQLDEAFRFETAMIIDQLKSIHPDYKFKFAEIVVNKRIDDRIFSTDPAKSAGGRAKGNLYNPPSGTVVASDIVSNNFDFLLVSQNVTQGTCTPTHYNVIYNDTGLSQDVFWNLTYSQCFNYFNWNGSVKVPAPVQYAHKLAYLVGQTIQGEPNVKLEDTFYYL